MLSAWAQMYVCVYTAHETTINHPKSGNQQQHSKTWASANRTSASRVLLPPRYSLARVFHEEHFIASQDEEDPGCEERS